MNKADKKDTKETKSNSKNSSKKENVGKPLTMAELKKYPIPR